MIYNWINEHILRRKIKDFKKDPLKFAQWVNENVDSDFLVEKKDKEVGGPDGPEPTRFGTWENKGREIDF